MPGILRRMIHGFANNLHWNRGRLPRRHGRFVHFLFRISCTPKCKTKLLLHYSCPRCLEWGEAQKSLSPVWLHECPINLRQVKVYGQLDCPLCGRRVTEALLVDIFLRMTTD